MSRIEIWFGLGAIPKRSSEEDGEVVVVVLILYEGHKQQALRLMEKAAEKRFKDNLDQAICECFNSLCGSEKLVSQLSKYFKKIGVPSHELPETVGNFLLELAKLDPKYRPN